MAKGTNDPLASKSQALKAALAAVERMDNAPAHRAAKANDLAAENRGPKPVRTARPASDASSTESHKSGDV